MDRLLNVKEAAGFLKVSEITIRRWTNVGRHEGDALQCLGQGGLDVTTLMNQNKLHHGDGMENPADLAAYISPNRLIVQGTLSATWRHGLGQEKTMAVETHQYAIYKGIIRESFLI
jgi:hypothetical protein